MYHGDNLNANFIIGKSLLVVPALDYNEQQKVTVYLPNQNWYHFTDYSLVSQFDPEKKLGKTVQLDADLENVNLLIRGGSIVPFQNTATVLSTKDLMDVLMTLIIAPDGQGRAEGSLIYAHDWQRSPYFEFAYGNNVLKVISSKDLGHKIIYKYDKFTNLYILGKPTAPKISKACLFDKTMLSQYLKVDEKENYTIIGEHDRPLNSWREIESIVLIRENDVDICDPNIKLINPVFSYYNFKMSASLKTMNSPQQQIYNWTVTLLDRQCDRNENITI